MADIVPYSPTVYTGSKDYTDELNAAKEFVAKYGGHITYDSGDGTGGTPYSGPSSYQVPSLAMAYSTSPDFIAIPGTSTSTSSSLSDTAPNFTVDLGVVSSTEQALLTATSSLIDKYNLLVPIVNDAVTSPSIWGQDAGKEVYVNPDVHPYGNHGPQVN